MEFALISALVTILSAAFWLPEIWSWDNQIFGNSRRLAGVFKKLGDLTNLSRDEIISAAGPPQSISAIGDRQLLQWVDTGFHVAILFEGERCLGIDHEFCNVEPSSTATIPEAVAQRIRGSSSAATKEAKGDSGDKSLFSKAVDKANRDGALTKAPSLEKSRKTDLSFVLVDEEGRLIARYLLKDLGKEAS